MTAPIASGWSEIAGWALHPLESAAFSRRTPIPAVRMTNGSARLDNPTLTAAGHGSLTALTLTSMGRLPKPLSAIR
jgi:hypothetical protein